MRKRWIVTGLALMVALPAAAQKKEEERVENAGNVMTEILNVPDDIPQDLLDKAQLLR